jgi:hypothetical protein
LPLGGLLPGASDIHLELVRFLMVGRMSQRWLVHSGVEVFGPWTAEEVRSQLRAGRIDAFDLVSLEGSARKRPLVDVDEIFINTVGKSGQQFSESSQRTESRLIAVPSSVQDNLALKGKPSNQDPQQLSTASGHSPANTEFRPPRAFEALAAPTLTSAAARPASQSSPATAAPQNAPGKNGVVRRYILWIPGQNSQGPFTSREVLTLWYARKIPAQTFVQKAGTSKRISIAHFAVFYERAAPSGIAFVGEARAAAGVFDASTRWLIWAFIVGFLVIMAAILWRYRREELSGKGTEIYRSILGDQDDFTRGTATSEVGQDDAFHRHQAVDNNPRVIANRGAGQAVHPNRKQQNSRARQPKVERAPSRVSPTPKPPTETRSVVSKASPAATRFTDGAQVTLTGYRFNISALSACELKCKIPMSGPQGSVTAVFFKEAFLDGLSRKSSGLSITGTIKRDPATGGVSIFVQSVK